MGRSTRRRRDRPRDGRNLRRARRRGSRFHEGDAGALPRARRCPAAPPQAPHLSRLFAWTKKNTEPVAPSSTTPTSFPPGLAASAYDPQERLQPRSAPCSVPRQPTTQGRRLQGLNDREFSKERKEDLGAPDRYWSGRLRRCRSSRLLNCSLAPQDYLLTTRDRLSPCRNRCWAGCADRLAARRPRPRPGTASGL
jgi:hypothetical protein